MTELCDLSAVELRRLIGRKKVSPLELLDSCLMRIRATDGAINDPQPRMKRFSPTPARTASSAWRYARALVVAGSCRRPAIAAANKKSIFT